VAAPVAPHHSLPSSVSPSPSLTKSIESFLSSVLFLEYSLSLSAPSEGRRWLLYALPNDDGADLATSVDLWPPAERGPSPSAGRRLCPAPPMALAWDSPQTAPGQHASSPPREGASETLGPDSVSSMAQGEPQQLVLPNLKKNHARVQQYMLVI
jgi:hypothetical protein